MVADRDNRDPTRWLCAPQETCIEAMGSTREPASIRHMSQKADQVRDHWSFGDNNQVKATVNGQVYLDLTDLVD